MSKYKAEDVLLAESSLILVHPGKNITNLETTCLLVPECGLSAFLVTYSALVEV